MKRTLIYMMCATALMSSCRIYKSYERPENLPVEGLYRDTTTTTGILTSDTINFGNMPWREVFTDPQLQVLIQKGLERNTDLQQAELSVKQAEATLSAARLAYLPSFALAPTGTLSSFNHKTATKTYTLPITADWQLDIFGSLRNANAKAKSALLQSQAYKQAVQTQVIAGLANAYYTLLMLDEQLTLTKETAAIWKKNVEVLYAMKEAAYANTAEVSSTEAAYHQVCASIPTLEQNIRETENAISILLREAPHAIARGKMSEQRFPSNLSAGIPLQLLSNRPDVKAAEMSLRAAFYNTNAAYSAFYPQITINGTAGWTNNSGAGIVNPGKFIATAIGSLTQPLFARGQLVANLKIAKAQQESAQLGFEQALLNAGEEVSNALYQYQAACSQQVSREQQVVSLNQACQATEALFQLNENTTYLETLTARQSLLSAQLSLVSDKFSKMQAVVNLYAALGGGRN